jgi:hypothetical protein
MGSHQLSEISGSHAVLLAHSLLRVRARHGQDGDRDQFSKADALLDSTSVLEFEKTSDLILQEEDGSTVLNEDIPIY